MCAIGSTKFHQSSIRLHTTTLTGNRHTPRRKQSRHVYVKAVSNRLRGHGCPRDRSYHDSVSLQLVGHKEIRCQQTYHQPIGQLKRLCCIQGSAIPRVCKAHHGGIIRHESTHNSPKRMAQIVAPSSSIGCERLHACNCCCNCANPIFPATCTVKYNSSIYLNCCFLEATVKNKQAALARMP